MKPAKLKKTRQSNQISRPIHPSGGYLHYQRPSRKIGLKTRILGLTLSGLMLGSLLVGGGLWLRHGTVQGVPNVIIFKFLVDKKARSAYFSGQSTLLHDRLGQMGIEEDIKAFYRDQYPDEVELDWFIHQLLYDRTGYIGKAYKKGPQDQLILKTKKDFAFPHWFALARKAEIVVQSRQDNGIQFVKLRNGTEVTYDYLSDIYTVKILRQLIRQQKQGM